MIRVICIGLTLAAITLILVPLQLAGVLLNLRLRRRIPHLYHRIVCALIGVRVHEVGIRSNAAPTLILANHVSWLDVPVISALLPVVFVAKHEVARWPVLGWLARLQNTVFINRQARHQTGAATREIASRLLDGNAVVLFAEGTSNDGTRILPFRSSPVGAVHHALGAGAHLSHITVQPMSLAYSEFSGVRMGRRLRQRVAWYGDVELLPHLVQVVLAGAVDVTVSWGEPKAYDLTADRKVIAREAELAVRRMTSAALRADPAVSNASTGHTTHPLPAKA